MPTTEFKIGFAQKCKSAWKYVASENIPVMFCQQSNFAGHQRIHTCDRPYTCGMCNKVFTNNISLVEHHCNH
jgi:hypothetical protein